MTATEVTTSTEEEIAFKEAVVQFFKNKGGAYRTGGICMLAKKIAGDFQVADINLAKKVLFGMKNAGELRCR